MGRTDNRRVTPMAEDAYEVLRQNIQSSDGIVRADASELLQDDGFSDDDAEYAIQQLLRRGYLYEVDGSLFVTEPE